MKKHFSFSPLNALTCELRYGMKTLLLIFAGGGAGSLCRYAINKLMMPFGNMFPYGTLLSNVLSCFFAGLILAFSLQRSGMDPLIRALLLTGFCGGFSTFSTLTTESYDLFQNGRVFIAFLNVAVNFISCTSALMLGLLMNKFL